MREIADLRRALVVATADLAPASTATQIVQAGRRRKRRQLAVTGAAALAVLAVIVPSITPSRTSGDGLSAAAPARAPASAFGPVRTNVPTDTGGELVLRPVLVNGIPLIYAERVDPTTGRSEPLNVLAGGGVPQTAADGFTGEAATVPGAGNTLIHFGVIRGPVRRVTGPPGTTAAIAALGTDPPLSVYWVTARRKATGKITALDGRDKPLDVILAGDLKDPQDQSLVGPDSPVLGELVRTGQTLPNGQELVVWFVGDDRTAMWKTGERNPATGRITDTSSMRFSVDRTAPGHGFDSGLLGEPGAGGEIYLGLFIGDVARMTATIGDGKPLTVGFAPWSAQPEVVVWWVALATGEKPAMFEGPGVFKITAYDRSGAVIGRHRSSSSSGPGPGAEIGRSS